MNLVSQFQWYDSKGNRWRIRQLDDATGKYKKIRLCSGQTALKPLGMPRLWD